MRLTAFFFTCLLVTSFYITPSLAQEEGEYLHMKEMYLKFDGGGATATVYFDLDIFGDLYVFTFGSRHLEPVLLQMFFDFDDIHIQEIGRDNAVISLDNISRKNDNYYFFNEKKLGLGVDELVVMYPSGSSKTFKNVHAIPNLFYETQ
jgi:hypothetical protein